MMTWHTKEQHKKSFFLNGIIILEKTIDTQKLFMKQFSMMNTFDFQNTGIVAVSMMMQMMMNSTSARSVLM